MTDIAKITNGLSDAQINALLFPNGYHTGRTLLSLRSRGLIERGNLTELGMQVRDYLKGQGDD